MFVIPEGTLQKLLQNRQGVASRIHSDRSRLSGGHLEVQNAIFSRAEIANTGLVEYGSGGSDGVAQEERTAGAYRCAQALEVSALRGTCGDGIGQNAVN